MLSFQEFLTEASQRESELYTHAQDATAHAQKVTRAVSDYDASGRDLTKEWKVAAGLHRDAAHAHERAGHVAQRAELRIHHHTKRHEHLKAAETIEQHRLRDTSKKASGPVRGRTAMVHLNNFGE